MAQTENQRSTLAFFGINAREFARFPGIAKAIAREADGALDAFYDEVKRTPDTAKYFASEAAMRHAKARQVEHWRNLFSGPARFILAGSGHIAGVINPPAAGKYQYWTSEKKAADFDAWLPTAKEHPGSWWTDWDKWLAKLSGEQIPARTPGDGQLKPIGDAPGEYVKVKAR